MLIYALLSALFNKASAGVSEWQTMQTQNLLGVRPCGFKSRHRHYHMALGLVVYLVKSMISRLFCIKHNYLGA